MDLKQEDLGMTGKEEAKRLNMAARMKKPIA